ncbi:MULTISPECIES: 5-formyltetrahydrofolate cyclo-ligase [Micromonospora]|uniref:5-formyltetrahydrofolate cyclo-ligase n=1 Tax=Micromonospora TaxID=1873 RepID=UPI001EE7D2D6|nr:MULTISPECIES: 5-formyltetrahydrofolate cyclo-ligase [Micromonospora]MCG5449000.1 5-formyltetrahydrofolate cyclo-ligase [Micromonospora hortensis]MCX5118906.1 5-formyltetrahydrofolate cyclo-ligase [Micromonospora sp. NBC_00362]WTI08961.1 5-formyltetrahydrofolate cyclo-ligase [Micromonospora sp. NBC_00821]
MPEFSDEAEVTRMAKRDTRVELLARRRSLPAETRAAAAGRVQAELVSLVRRLRPHRMTAYVPVGSEPGGADLPEVLRAALPADAELLLPVLLTDLDLDWAAYAGPAALIAAGRGIREPVGARLGVAAVAHAELVVVPALAVDRHGRRLGRGGGSYDRALARVPQAALTVVPLHDGELVEALPAEPHDRQVRAVVTPADGVRTLDGGPGAAHGVAPHTSAGRTRAE